jgi:hypothetical protein
VSSVWGARWVAALEALGPDFSKPLARARAQSGSGHVAELAVSPGRASGRVMDRRGSKREVRLEIDTVEDVEAATSPASFNERLEALLPVAGTRIVFRCACSSGRPLCRHGAALAHALGSALDADPTVLLELRGLPRAATATAEPAAPVEAPKPVAELTWDEFVGAGQPAPDLHFHLEAPEVDGLVLKQLGVPRGATGLAEWQTLLIPVYRRVAAAALRMGLDEEPDEEEGGGA